MITPKNSKDFAAFCTLLCELRQQHRLSQKKMAALLHISVASLRKLERGEMPRISVALFLHVHRVFGISPADQLRDCGQ